MPKVVLTPSSLTRSPREVYYAGMPRPDDSVTQKAQREGIRDRLLDAKGCLEFAAGTLAAGSVLVVEGGSFVGLVLGMTGLISTYRATLEFSAAAQAASVLIRSGAAESFNDMLVAASPSPSSE